MRGPEDVVVYLAGVEWDAVRGTDRHLATGLARSLPVVWVDPPLSVAEVVRRRDRAAMRHPDRVQEVADGIRRVSLLAPPFPGRRGVEHVTGLRMRQGLRSVLRRLGSRVVGTVNTSPYVSFDVVPRGAGHRLYLATDDFVAGARLLGHPAHQLERSERRRLAEADLVAGVSPQILARWGAAGRQGTVIANGCDVRSYDDVDRAPSPADVDLPGPIAGVVGQLSSRLDLSLLEAVADAGTSLLLVGPRVEDFETTRMTALLDRPNVVWVGAKAFEELPAYLRVIDVGLTPYSDTAFNRASFPLKTLEYLAAGRAVVSTPLPAVAALGTDLVTTAEGPEAFGQAVRRLAEAPRSAQDVARRREFARGHDWSTRADLVLDALGLR